MIAPRRSQLIAVVGGSGAGKGWLVERLCGLLGDRACHLELDHFYRDLSHLPPEHRAAVNFDEPGAIDWEWAERVLLDCRVGNTTRLPRYDFATHCRQPEQASWEPQPLVFVDGLWLLRRPRIRALFDLKIFLNTPTELRRSRRLARDVRERGYSVSEVDRRFTEDVTPMHERHVAPQKKWADLVLDQPFRDEQLVELARRLWLLLEHASPFPLWMHETFRAELVTVLSPHEPAR